LRVTIATTDHRYSRVASGCKEGLNRVRRLRGRSPPLAEQTPGAERGGFGPRRLRLLCGRGAAGAETGQVGAERDVAVAVSSAQRQVESARQAREQELAEKKARTDRNVGVELLDRIQELNSGLWSMSHTTVEAGGPSTYSPEAAGLAREALAQSHRVAVTRLALVEVPEVRVQYQRLVNLVIAYATLTPAAGLESRIFP
jgi:hypothetical protein